jgi:hypothetical protein
LDAQRATNGAVPAAKPKKADDVSSMPEDVCDAANVRNPPSHQGAHDVAELK